MKEYDYAAALEHCKEPDLVADQTRAFIDVIHLTTIIHALRFAEKMMQEPSKGMRIAADNCLSSNKAALKKLSVREVNETFKSMRDQALKELGE